MQKGIFVLQSLFKIVIPKLTHKHKAAVRLFNINARKRHTVECVVLYSRVDSHIGEHKPVALFQPMMNGR